MSNDTDTITSRFDEDSLSDRQRQMLNVVRADKGPELDEWLTNMAKQAHASYAQITGDDTRTAEWKAERLTRTHEATMAAVDQQLAKMAGASTNGHRDDFGRAFGTVGVPGDAASLAISRRDAGDRVASISKNVELLRLLERANVSGDEVLARAVAEKAYTDGNATVLHRFLETRPELDAVVERLWNRRGSDDQAKDHLWAFAMKITALRPPRQ